MRPSQQDKENYRKFYESLVHVIPCGFCCIHYKNLLQMYPIDLRSMPYLFAWTVKIHNQINLKLKKPQMTVEDAKKIWTKNYHYDGEEAEGE